MNLLGARKLLTLWHHRPMAAAPQAEAARLREWFHQALDLAGSARERFITEVTGGDAILKERLEALIRAHERAGDFLLDPTAGGAPENDAGVRSGEAIGPYRLLDEIGSGGFGIVFRAEQREPVRRTVAVKVLKPGMDTRQVIARFEAERQALALMDHPHIAKVFDAGATAQGRPYFAMEFVEGEPINDFADRHQLDVTARLRLFLDVCHAVQHAHQKGVIHRDLKPSNILVAELNDVALPKVIDFGIAKATGTALTEKTLVTQASEFVGTPTYISPEQVELSVLGVDTRADIYSLGVVLYELLTGTTPIDARTLSACSLLEVRQLIVESDPPRPSARAQSRAGEGADFPMSHGADGRHLPARLRGDLDWIVMKALEKDRTRRYPTVEEFARDIERHLCDEPVEARPPGRLYRVGKFVRRHRPGVAAAGVAGLAITAGLAVAVSAWLEAKRNEALAVQQGRRAREVTAMLKGVFDSLDPTFKGSGYTVRQLLDDYSRNFPLGSTTDTEPESELRLTMGRAFVALGEYQRADPQLQRVLAIAEHLHGARSPEAAVARRELGLLRLAQKSDVEALNELSLTLEIREEKLGPNDAETRISRAELAEAELGAGHPDRARAHIQRILSPGVNANSEAALLARSTEAEILFQEEARAAALKAAQAVASDALKVLGPRHRVSRLCANRLATRTAEQQQNPGRQKSFEEQLRGLISQLGIAHPETLRQTIAQLQALVRSGQQAEAQRRLREVISMVQAAGGLAVGDARAPLSKLVAYAAQTGRLTDFEIFISDGVALAKAVFKPGDAELSWLLRVAALLHHYRNDLALSESLLREAGAASLAEGPQGRAGAAEAAAYLQDTLARGHRLAEAEALLGPDPPLGVAAVDWAGVLHYAAVLRLEQSRSNEGIELGMRAWRGRRDLLGTHPETLETAEMLRARALQRHWNWGIDFARSAADMATTLFGENDVETLRHRHIFWQMKRLQPFPTATEEIEKLRLQATALLPGAAELLTRIEQDAGDWQQRLKRRQSRCEAARLAVDKARATFGDASREFFLQEANCLWTEAEEAVDASIIDRLLELEAKARKFMPPDDGWFFHHHLRLGRALGRFGRDEEASVAYREAFTRGAGAGGLNRPEVVAAAQEVTVFWRRRGRNDRFWQAMDDFQEQSRNAPADTVLLPRASWWSYWGDAASVAANWREPGFDDHQWLAAKGWLNRNRANSGSRVAVWPPGSPPHGTLCLRAVFEVTEPHRWRQLRLRLSCDEAAGIHLNGRPLARSRLPDGVALTAAVEAPLRRDPLSFVPDIILVGADSLRSGRNVIAVEIHPVSGGENDLFFELQVEGIP